MRRAFVLVFLLIPVLAQAQQPNVVPREQSKLQLDMPGLENQRAIHQYFGWNPQYTIETSYAAQTPRAADYPRAQVYLRLLAPGMVWKVNRDVDARFVQNFVPYFKDKKITMLASGGSGTNEARRIYRFEVDGAECVFFAVTEAYAVGGGASTTNSGGGNLTSSVVGIYCGAASARLSDDDVAKVLKSYKVVQNPGK
jgi:hypothetical protein